MQENACSTVDSGAAVSLIHLQAYKLMPDTLKTAITLPAN